MMYITNIIHNVYCNILRPTNTNESYTRWCCLSNVIATNSHHANINLLIAMEEGGKCAQYSHSTGFVSPLNCSTAVLTAPPPTSCSPAGGGGGVGDKGGGVSIVFL